jgi:predicted Ser/Thr protein kinase
MCTCICNGNREPGRVVSVPSKRIGPYDVLRKLGAGGMGTVYLALDEEGRTVAVKVIHPHIAEDVTGLRRLAREVDTMKRVASPYVAELLDANLRAEPAYIVTRYVQGRSLQQIVERGGPLTDEKLASLGVGLMAALDAIHAVGVVHRDLTPHNVMIADGAPVVIDFGIAQAFDATRITQALIGTPGFVAPEVIRGERAGPPADIFSWGATMAFAATARRCFAGQTVMETLTRTLEKEPDLAGVPCDLVPPIWVALKKNPSERPSVGGMIGGFYTFSPDPWEAPWSVAPQPLTSASRIAALWAAAGEAREKGEVGRAEELYAEVWQIAVKAKDPGSEMFALFQLGSAAEFRCDYEMAQDCYEQTLQVARSLRSAPIEALALSGLERLAATAFGDSRRAQIYAEQVQQALDSRYAEGYPKPPEGTDDARFLRRWTPW